MEQQNPPRIFNGKITIVNRQGEHRTFQIKTQKKDARFAPGKRIIALLSGPDNQHDFMSFGFVDDNGVHVWQKHRTKSFLWFAELINVLVGKLPSTCKAELFEGYEVMISKRCLRCNRELTTPESIESGIGPVCAGGY